jgi:pimeloyl-ACP methyl ester carboxylesterase
VAREGQLHWAGAVLVVVAVATGTIALSLAPLALAQDTVPKSKATGKTSRAKGQRPGAIAQKKAPPNAADPLAGVPKDRAAEKEKGNEKAAAAESFHYRLRTHAFDDVTLATSYYPGKPDPGTPAVLLVHDRDRSSKDFEDPISELKGKSLAEHLQSLGYAVLAFDLRGYGANTRRVMSDRDWRDMVDDLQSAYQFLVDRHNRGELNLARLGVVALGEGANLAAAWAYLPGGAVSHEGRVTDLAGLVLVSPMPTGQGYTFPTLMNSIAPRIPVLLIAGERDGPSHEVVKRVRANVEKTRQNRVELFPSALHGYKLLRLEPRATAVIERFLEATVKLKATDWEPRYNLTPVTYTDIQIVRHSKPADMEKQKEQPKVKDAAPKANALEKGKAKDAAGENKKDQAKDPDTGKAPPKNLEGKSQARSSGTGPAVFVTVVARAASVLKATSPDRLPQGLETTPEGSQSLLSGTAVERGSGN